MSFTTNAMNTPSVTVVIPCHNEEAFIGPLLDVMFKQVPTTEPWRFVAVDDASTDGTAAILEAAAFVEPRLAVVRGRYGSPGGARSAGVAAATAALRGNGPDWIVTLDADVELATDWFAAWHTTLGKVHSRQEVGAINGMEEQGHLFTGFPRAAKVSAAFGLGIVKSETLIGPTNLNGVNHAVRLRAYETAGPYLQPTAPGVGGLVNLAGEDWDLGVRLRLAGFTVAETPATVIDRGRRLLADVHAYVSGEAYEGAFHRVIGIEPSTDIHPEELSALIDSAVSRSLRHFFLKPILAGAVPLDSSTGLSPETIEAMRVWIARWPWPSFSESRNGFIFGRLARFADTFIDAVRADLRLAPADLV